MIVLIDGDLVTYPCASASEGDPVDIATYRCNEQIRRILYELNSEDYRLFIRGDQNFRYNIWQGYKANRTGKPVPKHLEACRENLVVNWNAEVVNGIETDDRLGIEQVRYGTESIIASYDKDLLQIPGHHYNFKHGIRSFVTPFDGWRTFYKQVIAGDGADNVPSYDGKMRQHIPNFIKALQKPIDEMTDEYTMYRHCIDVYFEVPREEDDVTNPFDVLKRNCQLLYILREEGVHWQEPKEPVHLDTNPPWNDE